MEAVLQSPSGQTILEPDVVTIGSTSDNRLVVHDAKVSPHHAILRPTEQGYTITDEWSTEGTFVNEQRLDPFDPRLLTAGDRIRIGETVFTYEVHEGAALVAGQESRPESEPAASAVPSEYTSHGVGTQPPVVPAVQAQYRSAPQQEYVSPPQQQSYTPAPLPYTGMPPVAAHQPAQGNGAAVASLVLGIISMVAWLLPILGLPLAIVGVVLGHKGRRLTMQQGMATAGLVLCYIALGLAVLNAIAGAMMAMH